MAELHSKTTTIILGVIGAVIAAAIIAYFGIGAKVQAGVTIEGPTVTVVDEPIQLTGRTSGEVSHAYWTDELGQTHLMTVPSHSVTWSCPTWGTFSLSLTAVMRDGAQYQAKHEIQCF